MRKINNITLTMLLVTFLSSCEKYLDIKTSNQSSPIETAEDCQKLLDNYERMNQNYPSDGNLSSDEYTGNEIVYNNSIGQEDRSIYTWQPSAIRQEGNWADQYIKVDQVNIILEKLADIRKKGKADLVFIDRVRGAALFFRAYTFWQVAQLYAKPYNASSAGQDPGIPLRLISDVEAKSPRGTVEQTYSKIVADLQEAATLLEPKSAFPSRPDKAACYAMLARVYQGMEDYPAALLNANAALAIRSELVDFTTLNKESETPFNPHYNKEVIFHSTTHDQNLLNPNFEGTYSASIDPDLVATYNENDLRKDIFLKANTEGIYRFTGNYEPSGTGELFNGLAVDEMYLIRAESYARAGNTASAMADLNTLLSTRWVTGTYVPLIAPSAEEALAIVLLERRKELLMRGLRWTDLRRLNRDSRFAKTLTRTVAGVTYTLPPNDLRYTLLIPQAVITYGNIAQNPR